MPTHIARPADQLPVVLAASMDQTIRQGVAAALVLDLPGGVCVDYQHENAAVRRVVSDWTGRVYDDILDLDHDCVSCTVREDIVATLAFLRGAERWRSAVVLLPPTASPVPYAHELQHAVTDGRLTGLRLSAVVSLVDLTTLETDLLGDDLLTERGMALSEQDRRSVGEALAAQVEFSDVVLGATAADVKSAALLARIVAPTSRLHLDWTQFPVAELLQHSYDHEIACERVDPMRVWTVHEQDRDEVWTLELRTGRPLHPGRLMERIEDLGGGRIRARGHFWLASRPEVACAWDASGGQLSIGTIGGWAGFEPGTRLTVTGVDLADRARILRAFTGIAITSTYETDCLSWSGEDDGFEPWLG